MEDQPAEGTLVGGKYRLIRKIAEGGGGAVWETNNGVALKFLKWSPLKSRKVAAERFKNEFAILKSLSHPNISEIYDFGFDQPSGLYFFTTEFLTAGDLKSMMSQPLPVLESLLLQALRALEYLRGNGLLHLDIKPQNLLLRHNGRDPELAVIDFGLATFRPPDKPGGTANYMPPEMIVRRLELAHEYPPPDHRSDLYSLGVTFYYCLTGIHPFAILNAEGKIDSLSTLKNHLDHEPMPPSTYRPDIPAYLDRIIMKLMARHPDDRYPSAIVAAQALEYRSPHSRTSESKATLLAYLPREGKLIGRHKEREIIEQTIKDTAENKPHIAPIVLIAGSRGTGRTRLIKAIKPFAQQMEMDVQVLSSPDLTGGSSKLRDPPIKSGDDKLADGRPLVFLLDDIDSVTQNEDLHALIRKLKLKQRIKDTPGPGMALIMTLNTDHMDLKSAQIELGLDEHLCHTIELKNFTSEEVAEYLTAVLGERPDDAVINELKRCTDGNPLVITEHMEEMIAKGRLFSLAGRPDAKTLKTIGINFSHSAPPKSLSEMVKEKLSHLPQETRRLALLMACFGRPVSAEEIGDPSSILLLTTADLIRKQPSDGRFIFTSALTAKAILNLAPQKERAACHDEILKKHPLSPCGRGLGRGGDSELLYHTAYGSNLKKAIPALWKMAETAMARFEPIVAAEHLNYLLHILPEKDAKTRADTLLFLGHAYEKARMFDEAKKVYERVDDKLLSLEHLGRLEMRRRDLSAARKYFERALACHSRGSKRESSISERIRLENFIAGIDMRNGKVEAAVAAFTSTAKLAKEKLKPADQKQITNNELGEALFRAGSIRPALKTLKEALSLASQKSSEENAERIAKHHYLIGNAFQHQDVEDFDEALSHYNKALTIARANHLIELQVRVLNGLGNLMNFKLADPAKALTYYREAIGLAQQLESETTSIELMIGMGLAAQKMHKTDATIEYLEAALDFTSGPKGTFAGLIRRYAPTIYVSLADAYYQQHDLQNAERFLKEAEKIDRKHALSPEIRYSLYGTLMDIFIERNELERAEKLIPTLTAIAKVLPMAKAHFEETLDRIRTKKAFKEF